MFLNHVIEHDLKTRLILIIIFKILFEKDQQSAISIGMKIRQRGKFRTIIGRRYYDEKQNFYKDKTSRTFGTFRSFTRRGGSLWTLRKHFRIPKNRRSVFKKIFLACGVLTLTVRFDAGTVSNCVGSCLLSRQLPKQFDTVPASQSVLFTFFLNC